MIRRFIVLVPALFFGAAHAQLVTNGLGTRSIAFNEIRLGGVLTGCELDFDQLLADAVTQRGRPVLIAGALTYVTPKPGTLALFWKVQPSDLSQSSSGSLQRAPFNPWLAYLSFGPVSTAARPFTQIPCEDGGYCAYTADEKMLIAGAEANTGFRVGYQRERGQLDVITSVTMPTPDQTGWHDLTLWGQCVAALARRLAPAAR